MTYTFALILPCGQIIAKVEATSDVEAKKLFRAKGLSVGKRSRVTASYRGNPNGL